MKSPLITAIMLCSAAGLISVPAAAQSDSPFNGPKLEIIGGYDTLRNGSDIPVNPNDPFDADGPDETVDGFAYGIAAGYDYDAGPIVIGIEAELMDSTGKQAADEVLNAPFEYDINLSRDLYIGARLGAKVTPTTLLYGKVGYTSTRVESRFQDRIAGDGIDYNFTTDERMRGYRLGAGVEQIIGKDALGAGTNAYAKLEYRYSNYSDLTYDAKLFGGRDLTIDLDRHQVVAAVGVRF